VAHPIEANPVHDDGVEDDMAHDDRAQDDRNPTNESLAHRLRNAAIERTTTDAERVDDFVIDKDGVLDLRELERDALGSSVADPARVLATIRGQLGDAHEVSNLYDESEPETSRWPFGRRSRTTTDTDLAAVAPPVRVVRPDPAPPARRPLSRLSMVPLTTETTTTTRSEPEDTVIPGTGVFEASSIAESSAPEIDLRDEGRPTANCPKCMGLGHRDLFDRFSQVEFYSCDNCMHMWQQDVG
jgi:hypothetical protein